MGPLPHAWTVARHDLRRRARDPLGFALWFAIPLVIAVLLRIVFGGDGGSTGPRADVLVFDRDDSFGSRLLVGALTQVGDEAPLDARSVLDEQAARAALDDGEHTALLVIPEGFQDTLLLETPGRLELVVNPAQSTLPAITQETLELLREAHFYLHRIAGGPLASIVEDADDGAPTDLQVAGVATEVNGVVTGLMDWLDPLRIELESVVEVAEDEGGGLDFAQLALASLLIMTLLFTAVGQSEDLWVEKQAGTLARNLASPHDAGPWIAGKLIAVALLLAAIATLGLLLARHAFGVQFAAAPLAVLWLAVTGGALFAAMLLLQSLGGTQRAGNLLTNGVLYPLLMLGGGFFPLELMPDGLAAIGRLTPLGLVVERLKAILAGGRFDGGLALDLLLALALAASLTLVLRARLRRFALR